MTAMTAGQPRAVAASGVNCTVKMVRVKPSAVCRLIRLPASAGGEASATRAENWAELGTIGVTQTSIRTNVTQAGPPKLQAVIKARRPLTSTATR